MVSLGQRRDRTMDQKSSSCASYRSGYLGLSLRCVGAHTLPEIVSQVVSVQIVLTQRLRLKGLWKRSSQLHLQPRLENKVWDDDSKKQKHGHRCVLFRNKTLHKSSFQIFHKACRRDRLGKCHLVVLRQTMVTHYTLQ